MQRVFNARLLFLHFHLGGRANLDHRNAAGQLGHALLQFFAVVVGSRLLDLGANLADPAFYAVSLARAVDDGGVLLADLNALGVAQVVEANLLQRQPDFLGDHRAAGQDGDVFQHGLAPVAEPRRLDARHLDGAAHVVDHQGGQGLAFDVLGDNQHGLARFRHALQHRQQVSHIRDLLVVQQDVGAFQVDAHGVLIVDEVRRQVAAVELHAFHHIQLVVQAGAFLNGDHAFFAHLLHGVGDDPADVLIGVGGDGANLGDGLVVLARLGDFFKLGDRGMHRGVYAPLDVHRIGASGNRFQALAKDRLGQHRRGGGAVARHIGGLGSHFLDHLRAHVFELVFQFDFLRHGNPVFGDRRRAKTLLHNDIATLRPQGLFNRVCQDVDASRHARTGVITEFHIFCAHCSSLPRTIR